MTAAERRVLLGDAVIAHIGEEVDAAPPPPAEVLADLRRILTHPALVRMAARPAHHAA